MRISTFFYCVRLGIVNIFKNRMMSFASLSTIIASMLVISIFYSVVTNIEYTIHDMENKVGVVVFFEENTTEDRILEIQKVLENKSMVHRIVYTSAEEAWEKTRKDYFKGREDLLEAFEDENPLKDSASLQVFLTDINEQENLVAFIEGTEDIRLVRQEKEVTNIMRGVNDLMKYISVVLISVLIVVSMFLISNTVRLGIEVRKREINIMKYIGATDTLIRLPFIIEGFLIGFIGAVIPLGIVYKGYNQVTIFVGEKFAGLNNFLLFRTVDEVFGILVPLTLGIGVVIGTLGSMLTIHRHLRV